MRFVVVEDEIRIREGIRKLLLKLDRDNLVVGEAENGQIGMELIRKENPDVVITDVKMPIMDGLEMLERIYEEGCRTKAIVLSAYSEFEYARTAIKLGVTEYLVKPIVISEFTHAINVIKEKIEKEKMQKPEQIGTLGQVFKNILNGDVQLGSEVMDYLERRYKIKSEMPFALLVAYFEKWEKEKVDQVIGTLKCIMRERAEISYCALEDEKQKVIQFIFYGYQDGHDIARWMQYHVLKKGSDMLQVAIGWTEVKDIYSLKRQYEEICPYMDWNITLGDEIIISYPAITRVQTAMCVYPVDIENKMKVAICTNSYEKLETCVDQFHNYFQGGKVYEPGNIKECYVRFFWAVINFSKEIGNLDYQKVEQQKMLEKIMQARTTTELRNVTTDLMKKIRTKEEETITNMTVRRSVAMIHEFYRTGITLEEISSKLDITPEYLGTQFHKEMGENFSGYIKNFKISKAKELLLSTQMKVYEIAEKTGYSDPKYFSKVFKETTGQLPADYRKTHR